MSSGLPSKVEKRVFNVAEFGGRTVGERQTDFSGQLPTQSRYHTKSFARVTLRESDDTIYINMHKVEDVLPMISDEGQKYTRLVYESGKYQDILETPEELGLESPVVRVKEYPINEGDV
jgi:hypothetical protein